MRNSEFRDLNTLLSFSHAYIECFKHELNTIDLHLWTNLEQTPNLDSEKGEAVISYFLELACQCQDTLNIELGRAGLLTLPKERLIGKMESVAEPILELNDEWEYRRLLEVSWKLSDKLVRKLALRGIGSDNAEVVEIAKECLEELSGNDAV